MGLNKHILSIVLLVLGAIPFAGLLVVANLVQSRSVADLALADRCVAWAHETHEAQDEDGPDVAARCDRYFRIRSEADADEDDRRWGAGKSY